MTGPLFGILFSSVYHVYIFFFLVNSSNSSCFPRNNFLSKSKTFFKCFFSILQKASRLGRRRRRSIAPERWQLLGKLSNHAFYWMQHHGKVSIYRAEDQLLAECLSWLRSIWHAAHDYHRGRAEATKDQSLPSVHEESGVERRSIQFINISQYLEHLAL